MAAPLTALLPFIGSIGGTATNYLTGYQNRRQSERNLQKELDFQMSEAQKARDFNLQMWNMSNQYNSPQQQMARLKAAGLNPNMVYGSGSAAGLSSGKAPEYVRPNSPNFSQVQPPPVPNFGGALSAYQDFKFKGATIQNKQYENIVASEAADFANVYARQKYEKGLHDIGYRAMKSKIAAAEAAIAPHLAQTSLEAKKANVENIKASARGKNLENDLNSLLKPYGLTTRDNVLMRQVVRIMQKENPGVSAIDVALLLPSLLPGIGSGVKSLSFMRSASRMSKAGRIKPAFRKFFKYSF